MPPPFQVYGAIGDRYNELGGPASWLGAPTSNEQPFAQGGRVSTFERGNIYWWPDTGAIDLADVVVRFKGLYCFGTTPGPGADEPYVTFGMVPAPPAPPLSVRSPIYTDVDEGNSRPDDIELYRGRPYGLALGVVLSEQDYGDPDKFRGLIDEGVRRAGDALTATCAGYGGPAVAELCKDGWEILGPELGNSLNDLLDTDDDIIEKWSWQISARDMVAMTRTPLVNHWGIEYHLESKVLEDGDASYKVYVSILHQ